MNLYDRKQAVRSDEHGHAGPRVFVSWYSVIGPPTRELASCVHLGTKHLASTRSHNTVAVKQSLPPTEGLPAEAREHEENGEAVSSPLEWFSPRSTKYFSGVSIFLALHSFYSPFPCPLLQSRADLFYPSTWPVWASVSPQPW